MIPKVQTEQILRNEEYISQTLKSNDNLKDTSIEDAFHPQRDQLKQLLEISNSMNYPNHMVRELKQMERALIMAEKKLELHYRQRNVQRTH